MNIPNKKWFARFYNQNQFCHPRVLLSGIHFFTLFGLSDTQKNNVGTIKQFGDDP